uniref:Uncharacterized protein n=1 Tax=Arundo donax TaxID=35708 RepID=A0A0A9HEW9_ARUDO
MFPSRRRESKGEQDEHGHPGGDGSEEKEIVPAETPEEHQLEHHRCVCAHYLVSAQVSLSRMFVCTMWVDGMSSV